MTAPAPTEPSGPHDVLIEERDFLLRSLRDLEAERAAGDIEESHYVSLRDDYTRRAADVARRIERLQRGEPEATAEREEAAEVAAPPPAPSPGDEGPADGRSRGAVRLRRAVIAVGVVLCVGGAGWAATAASGVRLPGETITGDTIGPEKVATELLAASRAFNAGHPVQALKDYQTVLRSQPDNPTALTGSASILVASNQSKLVAQGAVMLAKAEQTDPSYAPAYLYLGRALELLGDDASAVKQLHTFLADQPHGATATEARTLLAYAEKHAGRAGAPKRSSGTAPAGSSTGG